MARRLLKDSRPARMKISSVYLRRILYALALFAAAGAVFAIWLGQTYAGQPDIRNGFNAFYVLFSRDEGVGLGIVAIFCVLSAVVFFRTDSPEVGGRLFKSKKDLLSLKTGMIVLLIAAGVVAIGTLGTDLVCHNYALSADEFMADFQAKIFLHGHISAVIPPQWRGAVRVLAPTYAQYLPATHSWMAAYLPVYAAMRAIFQAVYLPSLLNPLLAGVTIVALFGVLKEIWPNDNRTTLVGMILLAGSSQFLLMSMTSYAMPAHLALNTIWLWLYLWPQSRLFWLAPFVGVLAIGLHQPVVHALFVAPFLFRLLLQKRWKAVAGYTIIYSLGCAIWLWWRHRFSGAGGPPASFYFSLWNPRMFVVQPMYLWLLLGWLALATPLLALIGCFRLPRAKPVVQDAALSCLLTFLFYCFFRLDQGNGWGYRYFHGVLTCAIILAAAGWRTLADSAGAQRAWKFVWVGTIVSVLIQLPLRCLEAESYIRPFAAASESIHSMDSQLVGVDPASAWYSADLIRNDPYLEDRPVVFALVRLQRSEVGALVHKGPARIIEKADWDRFGLCTTTLSHPKWPPLGVGVGP